RANRIENHVGAELLTFSKPVGLIFSMLVVLDQQYSVGFSGDSVNKLFIARLLVRFKQPLDFLTQRCIHTSQVIVTRFRIERDCRLEYATNLLPTVRRQLSCAPAEMLIKPRAREVPVACDCIFRDFQHARYLFVAQSAE